MKKNTKIKLAGVLLGAALSSTGAYAGNNSCGAKKGMDEMSGNSGKKSMMTCGAGKCGSKMMEETKKENHGQAQKEMMMEKNMMKKEAKKKVEGSCGAGKCG